MSTTDTTYIVTAVLPGAYERPGEIEVIQGASYEAAHAEYVRLLIEQREIIGNVDEVNAALEEAEKVSEAVELTTHFTDSWQIELRAEKVIA